MITTCLMLLVTIAVMIPSVLTLLFCCELVVGLRPTSIQYGIPGSLSAVVVMPAHDEAAIIAATIEKISFALSSPFQLLVVADNCEDDTLAIARHAGATAVARNDDAKVGKGFALAYARDYLAATPPDCVVVVDADCQIDQPSLTALARAAIATGRPVQAVNLLRPNLAAPPMVQVSNFAFMLKNLVRQRGLQRLGGRVNLTGTGMAFPWSLYASAALATDDIVEDLGLGLDLAGRGYRPILLEDATVWSEASTIEGTLKQRSRWEGGSISTSLRRALPSLATGLKRASFGESWAALSLLIPPVTLLAVADVIALIFAAASVTVSGSYTLLEVAATPTVIATLCVIAVWRHEGRPFLSAGAILRAPLYFVWKIPLYLSLSRRKPRTWIRTGR